MSKTIRRKRTIAIVMVLCVAFSFMPLMSQARANGSAEDISSPRVSDGVTTWDCVYFGSYPQTEVVAKPEQSGAYRQKWSEDSGYEVNSDIYYRLQTAKYDVNGDTVIKGEKYHRMTNPNGLKYVDYDWKKTPKYHYFRYDRIKWMVLNVEEGKALLIADKTIDSDLVLGLKGQGEDGKSFDVSNWSGSCMRSWLNGYNGTENRFEINYSKKNFIDRAFNRFEKKGIETANLNNIDGIKYKENAGSNTNDKIFLLSEADVLNGENAKKNGLCRSEFVQSKSTTFAKSMGVVAYSETMKLFL